MNVFQGLVLQGLDLNTEENFQSIPGLKLWLDGRERVTKNETGMVSLWGDKSSMGNNAAQPRANRRPSNSNGLWIDSTRIGDARYLDCLRRDYKFMHNGSPFACYFIMKININDTTGGVNVINTSISGLTGFRMLLSTTSSGRLTTNVYNAGSTYRSVFTNNIVLTYPGTSIVIVKHVFKGTSGANNIVNQYGNIIQIATSNITTYANSNSESFRIAGGGAEGKTVKTGLALIYDWTGQNQQNINDYDSRIMALLQDERQIFQLLDT